MNILFLTRAYGEHAGGMERLSYELAQHLSAQPETEVKVISHQAARTSSPLFNLTALPQALVSARKADVIYLGDPMLSLLGWKLKKLTGKPVAVTVHGLDITYPNFLYQLYLKTFFRKFDSYLPISKYVASVLKNHNVQGKIEVVNPGIADRFYDPIGSRGQLEKLLNQDLSGKKVLFTSGRLVKRKGHEWFIREVLPKLPENVIYVIAGDGPERKNVEASAASFERLVQRAGMELSAAERARQYPARAATPGQRGEARKHADEPKILFLGKVSDEQLKVLYNTVDVFIMPNIPVENDVEGFGLVLLEAALCNRPVFASALDGIPDAIQPAKNGTLLPAQNPDAWLAALADFGKSNESRTYTLEHFNWPRAAKEYLAALTAIRRH